MDPISEYQRWKQQGESLRAQAKQAMETRFRELLTEAAGIAQEYQRDFGAGLKPPPPVTTFRFKTGAAAKKKAKAAAAVPQPKRGESARAENPRLAELERRRVRIQKKIEAAKASGKAVKNLEDRLYEVEDELRLAAQTE